MSNKLIDAARQAWGFGEVPVTLVAARENRVYRVEAERGPVALRLHRDGYRSAAAIQSELLWMAMLAAGGMPVPAPVPALDGASMITIDGIVVDVLSWVDGVPLTGYEVTPAIYFELGAALGRMHELCDAWTLPPNFTRPTWDLVGDEPSWDKFWLNPALSGAQSDRFLRFRDHARNALDNSGQAADTDIGLIHADLIPDNVLYGATTGLQLIDFDDGGFGHRLFDLATITYSCKMLSRNNSLADAAVAGYTQQRSMDLAELPLYEAMRACTYVGWNISRLTETGGEERNARYIANAESAVASYFA